jgi:hypothetical protein
MSHPNEHVVLSCYYWIKPREMGLLLGLSDLLIVMCASSTVACTCMLLLDNV